MLSLRRAQVLPLTLAAGFLIAGCAKMDATLGQQWVDVTFKQSASVSAIEKVRTACSHVPNIHPDPLPRQHTVLNLMAGVRFDTTAASDANIARLQECVQRFSSVQGFTPGDEGDEGG